MRQNLMLLLVMGMMIGFAASAQAELSECVDDDQPCTIGGTPCCGATSTCQGTFPNTFCKPGE